MSQKLVGRVTLVTALVAVSALVGLVPANAATWNFNLPSGPLAATQNYTSGAITIQAAGFTDSTFATTTNLYGKNDGGNENGVGLDFDGDNEISGSALIRIDFSNARAANQVAFTFQMGSTTSGEGWAVYGSDSATTGYNFITSATNDEAAHTLFGADDSYDFYYFIYSGPTTGVGGANVLLASISSANGQTGLTPIPGALPLFASGLGGLGLLGWRRKRRKAATAA
jgi:hypothetical protein